MLRTILASLKTWILAEVSFLKICSDNNRKDFYVFILTSDGVSNWADEEQIKMAIQSNHLSFSRKLCSIAKKSGSNDDLSAVVIKTKSIRL